MSLRHLILAAGLLLAATGVSQAANPKLDAALGAFTALAGDAGKLSTYCDMTKAMASSETAGAGAVLDIDQKIENDIKALGPDFKAAMGLESELDPASADGKTYSDAIDVLDAKCGQ